MNSPTFKPVYNRMSWRMGTSLLVAVYLFTTFIPAFVPEATLASPEANLVLGQSDFTSNVYVSGVASANSLSTAADVFVTQTHVFVADAANNRILIWRNDGSLANGAPAAIVLGQADFTSMQANRGGNPDANTLNQPRGVHFDGQNLYVADTGNHRVLSWLGVNLATLQNGTPATNVTGQANFTSNDPNRGSTTSTDRSLFSPAAVYADGSVVYIADVGNNRVMVWDFIAAMNGDEARGVLGQPNFSSNAVNQSAGPGAATASSLNQPRDVFSDGNQLYVADFGNSRVLIWNSATPDTGAPATYVLGQADFTSTQINRGQANLSALTLSGPRGLYVAGGRIYVADTGNHRVLVWNTTTPEPNTSPVALAGQDNYETGGPNSGRGFLSAPSNKSLHTPQGIFSDGQAVYIAEEINHRVIRFAGVIFIPVISLGTIEATSIQVNINENGNIPGTQYALQDLRSALYAAADTSLSTTTAAYHNPSSVTVTGLTPNTQYIFVGQARNAVINDTSGLSAPASGFTRAAVPGNLTATAGGTDRINVSWTANGNTTGTTQYELIFHAGTAIITTTGTAHTVTGLSAGTNYSFRVRALGNDASLNSAYAGPVSATTNSSGGSGPGPSGGGTGNLPGSGAIGGSPITDTTRRAPTGTIAINGGDATTTNRNVYVLITATNTTEVGLINVQRATTSVQGLEQVRIAAQGDVLSQISFVALPPSGRLQWTLTTGNGEKTVCAVFRGTDRNEVAVTCDSIVLTEATFTCPLEIGRAYKAPDHPAVYLVVEPFDRTVPYCTKRVFENEDKYFSYYVGWSGITVIPRRSLELVPTDTVPIIPWGPKYNPKGAALVKTIRDSRVYYLYNGKKYWFDGPQLFAQLGYQWSWVVDVDEQVLNQYSVAGAITDSTRHPDGTLIHYVGSPRIYKLEDGKRRYIPDMQTLLKLGFDPTRVVWAAPTQRYEEGGVMRTQEVFAQLSRVPDVRLIKYPDSPNVYVLDQGERRHVKHESLFARFGWRWQDIFVIDRPDLPAGEGRPILI